MSSMFSNLSSSSSSSGLPLPGLDSLLSMTPLSTSVRQYVIQVYQTLAIMALVTTLGVYTDMAQFTLLSGGFLSILLSVLSGLAVYQLPKSKEYTTTRTTFLYLFAYLKGLSLRPFLDFVGYISPSVIPQAVTSTALVFFCFSAAAIYAKRRTMLYVGAMLGSAMSVMFWMGLFNLFFMSRAIFNVEVYLGLFVFAFYVMYDTQVMIHYATLNPHSDVLTMALDLYVNLISLFIRIAHLLAKNAQHREREKEKRRRD